MINPFENVHFPEVLTDKTYSYPEFRKKILRLLKTPDLTHVNIKKLISSQQKQDEPVLEYMDRVQHNVAMAFIKFSDANRQNLTESMFCQGLPDQEFARMTAVQATGEVASALRISASPTAIVKEQR